MGKAIIKIELINRLEFRWVFCQFTIKRKGNEKTGFGCTKINDNEDRRRTETVSLEIFVDL